MKFHPDTVVEFLYDIALDPTALNGFIDAWNEAGLDSDAARQMVQNMGRFDRTFQTHLKRADAFLNRNIAMDQQEGISDILAQFGNLAAFVVDARFRVSLHNEGAAHFFGITDGTDLRAAQLPPDARKALKSALAKAFKSDIGFQHLVKIDQEKDGQLVVFQVRKLTSLSRDGDSLVLVVTTNYHWNDTLGHVLDEFFGLTPAEQGVVRSLVEGRSAKQIALMRGTGEGTVRGQIKSILSKMSARSQSEIIRLVLSLRDVATNAPRTPALRLTT